MMESKVGRVCRKASLKLMQMAGLALKPINMEGGEKSTKQPAAMTLKDVHGVRNVERGDDGVKRKARKELNHAAIKYLRMRAEMIGAQKCNCSDNICLSCYLRAWGKALLIRDENRPAFRGFCLFSLEFLFF